jgi:hypothetical protein
VPGAVIVVGPPLKLIVPVAPGLANVTLVVAFTLIVPPMVLTIAAEAFTGVFIVNKDAPAESKVITDAPVAVILVFALNLIVGALTTTLLPLLIV